ncbi:MAG TPA: hypothetical protein VFT39_15940 [Vicinamibacterales bacterium]|nr:hypothetical protein [Vicinamibacterales bacterium]
MPRSILRMGVVVVLVTIVLECATRDVLAQALDQGAASSLGALTAQIPAGEIVYVTDAAGTTVRGKLMGMTNDVVELRVNATTRGIRANDVTRIQWQKRDSPLTGILIGSAIGAIPGIYWLIADPNECTGLCPEDYVAIGVGAIVGGLIDRAIKKRVTVYDSASRRSTKLTVAPIFVRERKGLQVAVTF